MIAVVGAGAAGLATAIFAARRGLAEKILLLDGAARLGAKILVSGGARCNVTNAIVSERDFDGSAPHLVRRVLRAFPVERTVAFFRELGVGLHEEENGKLFPDAGRSRAVLQALLAELERLGVRPCAGERVVRIETATDGGFRVQTSRRVLEPRHVVLATGGRSLPKSGSDGAGYGFAERLGHSIVPATPALVPLVLKGEWHAGLAGVAQPAELCVRVPGRPALRRTGSLLWTHFGISGPVVLDVSRHWLRAQLEGRSPALEANLLPGLCFEGCEAELVELATSSPHLKLSRALARRLPSAVAEAVVAEVGLRDATMGRLRREDRRALVHALVARPLPVVESRGWDHAEVTAGGIPLDEIDTRTMASRRCPGLFACGEIVDVDGRIGGFNFQWAWASAWVAAGGLAALW